MVDTENDSGSLYVGTAVAGTVVGEYQTINLRPPYSAQRYLEAITLAEESGIEAIIIDSLSHAWTGDGGLLDLQAKASARTGNSYTAWREVTPWHNKLVDKLLQCNMHCVVTLRTKTEYVIEESEKGKKVPRKVGLAPIFRDGLEFELTIFFELAQDHSAHATKDRTGLFDGQYFLISPQTGAILHEWLMTGKPAETPPQAEDHKREDDTVQSLDALQAEVDKAMKAYCKNLDAQGKKAFTEAVKATTGGIANYKTITDQDTLEQLLALCRKEPMKNE